MFFNSIDFAIFLPVVFALYWFVTNHNLRLQNFLLLIASYVFYGWWDWRFLFFIFLSSVVDYTIAIFLEKEEISSKRKILLSISFLFNLGLLAYFKYANFFIQNFVDAFSLFGSQLNVSSLNIILPVGISFYTFQTLSYTIDVYKKRLNPTRDFINFTAFVSFFPQLVAGPIERATNLLPQFSVKRKFEYSNAVNGTKQILWGLFKKVVIADTCAIYVNEVFNYTSGSTSVEIFIGVIFFAFQIYGDFSGYSDIAIGTARLFGFNLMQNFNFPYFSRDIAEFWRRWHISLSTWFRDYLYLPLGGSRGRLTLKIRNIFIIFLVSGFWHGANWTFIFWGFLNALFFLPLLIKNKNRKNLDTVTSDNFLSGLKNFLLILKTFAITSFAWIFFRADSMSHAFEIISGIFKYPGSFFLTSYYLDALDLLIFIGFFLVIEWFGRKNQYGLENIGRNWHITLRYTLYFALVISITLYSGKEQEFIYFQF